MIEPELSDDSAIADVGGTKLKMRLWRGMYTLSGFYFGEVDRF